MTDFVTARKTDLPTRQSSLEAFRYWGSILFVVAAAFAVVVGAEAAFGPFGTPWDGLFGIGTGAVCLFVIGVSVRDR